MGLTINTDGVRRRYDAAHPIPDTFVGVELNRDALAMANRHKVAEAANLTLFHMHRHPVPEEIVMGIAVAFTVMAKRCRLDPKDLVDMSTRILNAPPSGDHRTENAIQVLNDLIMGRIMGRSTTIG